MSKQKELRVLPNRFYGEPTRYEIVLPPGVDAKGARWLAFAAVFTAVLGKIGIGPVLKYIGILMLTTAGLTTIIIASLIL